MTTSLAPSINTAPSASVSIEKVSLRNFYANAADIEIERPSDLFLPDTWTRVFATGLQKDITLSGSHVLEVGVGTGVNLAGLLTIPNRPTDFVGTDLCNNAVRASKKLAQTYSLNARLLASDLLEDVPDTILKDRTHIVACIPQVPADIDLTACDNAAHYYNPTGSNWDKDGLGLNARLLEQVTRRAPKARVTLNLAGRPGIERLHGLFYYHGREPKLLHAQTVPQHAGTSLAPLAKKEANGHAPFEFFADAKGLQPLNASQAETRRIAQAPVFHKVYVITSTPI